MRTKLLLCLLALPIGCTVLNSFDDLATVAPADESGGSSSTGGMGGGSGGGDTGGDAGASSGGGSGGGTVVAEKGLVVAQAVDGADTSHIFLSALSPQTGEELKREDGNFTGLAYEADRDIWFLLKSSGSLLTPVPSDQPKLEARKFDRLTNAWTPLATNPITVPSPLDNASVFALPKRVIVLTYVDPSDLNQGAEARIYDTTDPNDIVEADGSPVDIGPIAEIKGGVVAPLPVGGNLNIVRKGNCVGSDCDLSLLLVQVLGDGISVGTPQKVGTLATGNPNVATAYNMVDDQLVLSFPKSDGTTGYIEQFDPQNHSTNATQYEFGSNQAQPRMAYDPCDQVAYVTGGLTTSITAVPFNNPTPKSILLGHNGQSLIFEPFTRSIFAPLEAASDYGITAFQINGTDMAPNLKKRLSDWSPPADLKPHNVAVAWPAKEADLCP